MQIMTGSSNRCTGNSSPVCGLTLLTCPEDVPDVPAEEVPPPPTGVEDVPAEEEVPELPEELSDEDGVPEEPPEEDEPELLEELFCELLEEISRNTARTVAWPAPIVKVVSALVEDATVPLPETTQ